MSNSDIVLSTLNAKYIHSSLALRYLYANLGKLQTRASIHEYTIHKRAEDIAEALLAKSPKILGLGVYIWNIEESTKLVAILKQLAPSLKIILGGPEVSYEQEQQAICHYADYVISGQGDLAFAALCHSLLAYGDDISTQIDARLSTFFPLNSAEKYINAKAPDLSQLAMPYRYYNDEDIAHRIIYVEASRGCPFKCEFCLSALDKTAYPFDLEDFLVEMRDLFDRGARHFKFVDRTFNLKSESSKRILDFFLELSQQADLFLHFELIPDNLPQVLRESIARFKPGSLQFEIGIQSLDAEVQSLISRKQDSNKVAENISWLKSNTSAHLHTDLIVGLPGADIATIAKDFDTLVEWKVDEIQVGILKRLRGTPIIRHSETYLLKFNPSAPYNILSTKQIDNFQIQGLVRFARFWDMIGNSGRFKHTLDLILGSSPFANFMRLTESLFQRCGQTHEIALKRLFNVLYDILIDDFALDERLVSEKLRADFESGAYNKGVPSFIKSQSAIQSGKTAKTEAHVANKRQRQHGKENGATRSEC